MLYITEDDLNFLVRLESKLGCQENWSDDVKRLWELNERLIANKKKIVETPICPYCGNELEPKCHTYNIWTTKFYYECSCGARTPMEYTPDDAFAAATKREKVMG